MPTQYSKFLTASCKEYVHPWTDSCVSATAGLGLHALEESLRIYTTVYLVTLLMKGKVPSVPDVKRTALGILQSTAFLSWSSFTYSVFICTLRRILGNFNVLSVSFFPSFLSSLLAIAIERPSRQTMLCLYVSNIATETLFKMGVWRGFFSPIPKGEVYIFAASIAALIYLYRTNDNRKDSIFKVLRFVIGPYEENGYMENQRLQSHKNHATETETVRPGPSNSGKKKSSKSMFHVVLRALKVYEHIINRIKGQSRHCTCPHPFSCVHYILQGSGKMFSIGVVGQIALKVALNATKVLKKPYILKQEIFKRKNLNLGIFLGGFAGVYRLIACSLRRVSNGDSGYHAIPAGLLASISFVMYPNNTVALYVMWKTLQLLWNREVEKGRVPNIKRFSIFLYCLSTAILFHAAIIEPQNLRPSYWKFLYNLSGGRLASMDRRPLDAFGYESSKYLQECLKRTRTTDQHTYSF